MWGDREMGEQGQGGDGLSFPQLRKTGARLQHSKVGSGKGKPCTGEGGERAGIFHSVTPAALGVWLHPWIPASLPVLGGARCGRQPSCLTRSDCSSSPWHKRHRKDFCSRHRVCLVVRKTVPPTLSLTHLAWVPEGGGMSQVQRSPTAPCISSLPSILILTPPSPPACRDGRRCCLPGNAGICSLSASPSAAAVFPGGGGGKGPPCDRQGGPKGRKDALCCRRSLRLLGVGKPIAPRRRHSLAFPLLRFSLTKGRPALRRCRVLCKNCRHLFPQTSSLGSLKGSGNCSLQGHAQQGAGNCSFPSPPSLQKRML